MARHIRHGRPTRPVRLDGTDRRVLAFAAEHRLVLEPQIERLVGSEPGQLDGRLAALTGERYLRAGWGLGARYYQIQRAGLVAIDSELPTPRFSLAGYKHDVGLAWLWLAAHGGTFGRPREVVSERSLRSHDGALDHPSEPYGVRLGGSDRYGNQRLHYPDLLVIDATGRRLALELELSPKGADRRELILAGYGSDRRIDHVLYLVEDHRRGRGIGRLIARSARAMGLVELVAVQLVKPLRLGMASAGEDAAQIARNGPARTQTAPKAAPIRTRTAPKAAPMRARAAPEVAR